MINLDLDLSLGISRPRLPSFVDCLHCGRPNIGKGKRMCGACAVTMEPTPLRRRRAVLGWSIRDLQRSTGLTERTLLRADAGDRMSKPVAAILSRHTGIPADQFRPKKKVTRE